MSSSEGERNPTITAAVEPGVERSPKRRRTDGETSEGKEPSEKKNRKLQKKQGGEERSSSSTEDEDRAKKEEKLLRQYRYAANSLDKTLRIVESHYLTQFHDLKQRKMFDFYVDAMKNSKARVGDLPDAWKQRYIGTFSPKDYSADTSAFPSEKLIEEAMANMSNYSVEVRWMFVKGAHGSSVKCRPAVVKNTTVNL